MPNLPRHFKEKGVLAFALWPLSLIWRLAAAASRLRRPARARVPVICVGNIVVGGTGKTPIVIALAKELQARGLKVGVISRGYGAKVKAPRLARPEGAAGELGDEPLLISRKLDGAPVAVCPNRAAAARLIESEVDVILMDDGLQNRSLAKDFTIAVFDGGFGCGNGFLLPAGPLREPLSALKRVNAIVITGAENKALERRLARFGKVYAAPSQTAAPKIARATAFAGIARPEKFFLGLRAAGIRLTWTRAFPDHHRYSREELEEIVAIARGEKILTTEKDFVKIPRELAAHFTPVGLSLQIPPALLKSVISSTGI